MSDSIEEPGEALARALDRVLDVIADLESAGVKLTAEQLNIVNEADELLNGEAA